MRVLVVGASGFLGGHVLRDAREHGHRALGTRASAARPGLVPFDVRCDRLVEQIPADFLRADGELVAIVCAAVSQPDRCARNEEARATNVVGMKRLCEDVNDVGGSVHFLSTGFVFDGERGGYSETDVPQPINEYGRQKLEMEEWLLARGALVVRVDKLVGDEPTEKHLFSEWQRSIDRGDPIVCLRGQVFSPTAVDDVARGLVIAAEKQMTGLYHVTGSDHYGRAELARLFLAATAQRAPIAEKSASELSMVEPRPLRTWLRGERFSRHTGLAFRRAPDMIASFTTKRARQAF
jgi:dTDP-4-dehydrorhamnose reductase